MSHQDRAKQALHDLMGKAGVMQQIVCPEKFPVLDEEDTESIVEAIVENFPHIEGQAEQSVFDLDFFLSGGTSYGWCPMDEDWTREFFFGGERVTLELSAGQLFLLPEEGVVDFDTTCPRAREFWKLLNS